MFPAFSGPFGNKNIFTMSERPPQLGKEIYGTDYKKIKLRIENFNQDWQKNESDLNHRRNLPIPVFIGGMPRSGKTMTESILACNHKLVKYGESRALENAIKIYINLFNVKI